MNPDLTQQGPGALYAALYGELKRQAHRERRRMRAGETLVTTALVNEAYLKLCRSSEYSSRAHFLNTAASAMRQVLVDAARASIAEKRGSGNRAVSLDDTKVGVVPADPAQDAESMLILDQLLAQLAALNPRLVQVVECRYFCGYSDAEIAVALEINERTVRRDWLKAKAWLYDALAEGGTEISELSAL